MVSKRKKKKKRNEKTKPRKINLIDTSIYSDEPERLPLIAIVGRPNVGKSTFFNRLVGKRSIIINNSDENKTNNSFFSQAIIHNRAGTTRDRVYGVSDWAGPKFQVKKKIKKKLNQ